MGIGLGVGVSLVDKALVAIEGKVLQQSGAYVVDENGSKVAYMMESPVLSEAHKRRIVAAINACAGISLEDLRALGVGGLATMLDRVRAGAREESQSAIGVTVDSEQLRRVVGGCVRTRKVYVVAWQYTGGAGFDWYASKEDAVEAFRTEQTNCKELRDELWTAYTFEMEVDASLMREEVTALIDGEIDERCAKSGNRFSVGNGMALAA
jgi:hypothetical protein